MSERIRPRVRGHEVAPLRSDITGLIGQIRDPTLQEPLRQAILEDGLFQNHLFEYINDTWVLSKNNLFELTRQSNLLKPELTKLSFDRLVSEHIKASMYWYSSISSNFHANPIPYYNQPVTLAWLCLIMTYQKSKEAEPGKRVGGLVARTIDRIGEEHPLRQSFKYRVKLTAY